MQNLSQNEFKLFNNNLYDDRISDIRRILRLRDILPKKYIKEIKKIAS